MCPLSTVQVWLVDFWEQSWFLSSSLATMSVIVSSSLYTIAPCVKESWSLWRGSLVGRGSTLVHLGKQLSLLGGISISCTWTLPSISSAKPRRVDRVRTPWTQDEREELKRCIKQGKEGLPYSNAYVPCPCKTRELETDKRCSLKHDAQSEEFLLTYIPGK